MNNSLFNKKPRYNLNFVLQETGLKADTLRAWERRYQLPQPHRTGGGHRLFSEYDIESIRWLLARQAEGLSISKAVHLWREIEGSGQDPLNPRKTSLQEPPEEPNTLGQDSLATQRNQWIKACLDFDEQAAEQVLTQAFACFPMQTVCLDILQAGLSQIGTLWYQGQASVQQEHFASELAIRRLQALTLAAPIPHQRKSIIVACPENEFHTFPALLIATLLRYRGWPVIYLGSHVPEKHLKETIKQTQADLVILSATRLVSAAELQKIIIFLKSTEIPVAFGGWAFEQDPDLANHISGYYLGGNIQKAISKIENFFSEVLQPTPPNRAANQLKQTHAEFVEKQNLINNMVFDLMKKHDIQIKTGTLLRINSFLSEDIKAALYLGNINLLSENMVWLINLMRNQGLSIHHLELYLSAFQEAVRQVLKTHSFEISSLIEVIQNKLKQNHEEQNYDN
ncbi:MAG: cobalamin-dependent protein [Anaerolineaceae bacterium]|nr:cobalamin-dependent protein [Anaerolineaceae bacterium]